MLMLQLMLQAVCAHVATAYAHVVAHVASSVCSCFRFCEELQQEEHQEKDRFLEECIQDLSLRDKMAVLTRNFQSRRRVSCAVGCFLFSPLSVRHSWSMYVFLQLVNSDNLIFNDDIFHIEPVEGDIWANSSMEVSVVFKPAEARQYTATAFCDITGRENRLPLRLRGDGVGPRVHFSFDRLDMGNIFVNSTHTYEVVLANKG